MTVDSGQEKARPHSRGPTRAPGCLVGHGRAADGPPVGRDAPAVSGIAVTLHLWDGGTGGSALTGHTLHPSLRLHTQRRTGWHHARELKSALARLWHLCAVCWLLSRPGRPSSELQPHLMSPPGSWAPGRPGTRSASPCWTAAKVRRGDGIPPHPGPWHLSWSAPTPGSPQHPSRPHSRLSSASFQHGLHSQNSTGTGSSAMSWVHRGQPDSPRKHAGPGHRE